MGPGHAPPAAPGNWLAGLARRLGVAPDTDSVTEHLDELRGAMGDLARLEAQNQEALAGLRTSVQRLEEQFSRAGKEQFRANTLAEARQQSLDALLEQQAETAAARARDVESLREHLTGTRQEGRLDVLRGLLPALDGLEEALASGRRLLQEEGQSVALTPAAARLPFGRRVAAAFQLVVAPGSARGEESALSAWVEGLSFVRDRLLVVLTAEGVQPIPTEGQPFDPHLHVAVDTAPAASRTSPGTIVREIRRGYARGDVVLRYAEVVVARET